MIVDINSSNTTEAFLGGPGRNKNSGFPGPEIALKNAYTRPEKDLLLSGMGS
jgi:hypothetical protein